MSKTLIIDTCQYLFAYSDSYMSSNFVINMRKRFFSSMLKNEEKKKNFFWRLYVLLN
jgi:hypothetical protein